MSGPHNDLGSSGAHRDAGTILNPRRQGRPQPRRSWRERLGSASRAHRRHPGIYGAVFCASPGAGYQPPTVLPGRLPRTYLVAGTGEPFFRDNATRWANALRDAGGDVVLTERAGSHGDAFWRQEFPVMVAWAFGH